MESIIQRYLRNIDKDFETLYFYTKYTSIYLQKEKEWESMDIYGTLVLYTSKGEKVISIFNKSNLKDITVKINRVKIEGEILTVNSKYGVWFHNKEAMREVFRIVRES